MCNLANPRTVTCRMLHRLQYALRHSSYRKGAGRGRSGWLINHPERPRPSSSLEDQASFNQCRLDCTKELAAPISTSTGVPVKDMLRFFHGDSPAQQYEAGNSVGGRYPCVGCGVESTSIHTLEHAFFNSSLSLPSSQGSGPSSPSKEIAGLNSKKVQALVPCTAVSFHSKFGTRPAPTMNFKYLAT